MMKGIRQTIWIASFQYRKFWNLKNIILVACSILFIGENVFANMRDLALQSGLELNYLEPVILVLSDPMYSMIIPLSCMVFLSDFPDNRSGGIFVLCRATRRRWFAGQMVYAAGVCISYLVILTVAGMLWIRGTGFFSVQWSPYMTVIQNTAPELYASAWEYFLMSSTLMQGTPVSVLMAGGGLQVLYLTVIFQVLCAFRLAGKKKAGLLFCIAVTVLGAASVSYFGKLKWLFPTSHAVFGEHFHEFFAQPEMTPGWSVVYFAGLNLLLGILNICLVRNCQIGDGKE